MSDAAAPAPAPVKKASQISMATGGDENEVVEEMEEVEPYVEEAASETREADPPQLTDPADLRREAEQRSMLRRIKDHGQLCPESTKTGLITRGMCDNAGVWFGVLDGMRAGPRRPVRGQNPAQKPDPPAATPDSTSSRLAVLDVKISTMAADMERIQILTQESGPSKVGGRRRFVAASNQSHRRLLVAES